MARVEYKIQYGSTWDQASGGTLVASDLQSVTIRVGRERPLDQYAANTATAVLRYPTGYDSPNSYFVSGTWVIILVKTTGGTWQQLFTGQISDVSVQYGIPYSGGVGNADFVTLSMEGLFAKWGRVQGGGYVMPAGILGVQTSYAATQTGLGISSMSSYGYDNAFPSSTISGTWGDWVNKTLLTMNGRLLDTGSNIVLTNQYYKGTAVFGNFSDVPADIASGVYYPYDQIGFSSYADNYYTQVTVSPESLTAQTVASGSAPYRTYQVNTLNNSTGQALDYANYLLSTYGTQGLRITSISIPLNNIKDNLLPAYGSGYIGTAVQVKFRGATYNCIVEGSSWSGTPDQAHGTLYLSGADLNNYLILNNSVYGKLDQNKLGY